jgi:hypothetical protein
MGEPSATAEVRNSKTLWFGMFASPVIWSLHLLIGYMISEAACMTNMLGFRILGIGGLLFVLVALTLLAMGGVIWNAWWSYRSWRYYASLNPEEEFPLQAYDRDEFLALSGLLLSGIFFLLLLLNLYPFLVLRPCV